MLEKASLPKKIHETQKKNPKLEPRDLGKKL